MTVSYRLTSTRILSACGWLMGRVALCVAKQCLINLVVESDTWAYLHGHVSETGPTPPRPWYMEGFVLLRFSMLFNCLFEGIHSMGTVQPDLW